MTHAEVNRDALLIAKLKGDFVAFLFVLWKALSLPKPTRCQIDMARELSNPTNKRFILQAFRGIGKSFITCAYVVWVLWRDPQLKIMIVSASKERADANSTFIKNIIDLLPFLHDLKPRQGQRDSVISFDVGPAKPDHSPSVKSVGITGQLTGSRADILIADDVEVPGNSGTQGARDKLWEQVKEFAALMKPNGVNTVIYLGTPQTEMTLYRELENRGYSTIIWPARYPASRVDADAYGHRLAPMLAADLEKHGESIYWTPTDSVRFDDEDLKEREIEYMKHGFAMQFMLNPTLADANKYPLKLRDLVVVPLQADKAPLSYQWLPNAGNLADALPQVGLKGDRYHYAHSASDRVAEYAQKILVIDPSGRGSDETGYAVLYALNGYIFLMTVGGIRGGYEDSTLEFLAKTAKKWKVNEVVIEANFGDGMYTKLLQPVLLKHHRCALVEYKVSRQKEVRMADELEPLMGSHKLIVSEAAIQNDYDTARDADGNHNMIYSAFYQMTRLTRDRGALKHDDRLDAIAGGVEYLKESVMKDSADGESEMTAEFLEKHMEKLENGWDTHRAAMVGDVTISWEDEDGGDNFMGW